MLFDTWNPMTHQRINERPEMSEKTRLDNVITSSFNRDQKHVEIISNECKNKFLETKTNTLKLRTVRPATANGNNKL